MSPDEDPWTIRIHHVGGIGEAGPLGVLSKLGNVTWTVYEAVEENAADSATTHPEYNVVPKAIGKRDGDATFYETVASSASSLLPTAPSAKDYAVEVNMHRLQVWGVHTQVRKTHQMRVRSLDSLVASGEAPPVDFLSIDAQGAELDIMEGAANQLRHRVVGLVIEAEFAPLYDGQPLFYDTMARLARDGFRVCDLLNIQYFYTYPYSPELLQDGFVTVAEVVYLKDDWRSLDSTAALKLAAVSAALGRFDYAVRICEVLEGLGFSLRETADKTGVRYLQFLVELCAAAEVVNEASPPSVEENGGVGPQSGPVPLTDRRLPDPVSTVLIKFGFVDLANRHMQRVMLTRHSRTVGWRFP